MGTRWGLPFRRRDRSFRLTPEIGHDGLEYPIGIRRCKRGVVPVSQRATTGDDVARCVIANGLEFPDRANAFEVAHVRSIGQVYAAHIGVDPV